ncbi:MAG: type II secretion system protein [Armatimonadetes bacterium]|nr:type II secretion system protein [Armatimonadota bacterium]
MKNRRKGFTLIELLTVIAIIAILAAILVPVFARAKDQAYRNGDISNMNQIRVAMGLYQADQGAYPPQLLGYVTLYTSGGGPAILPADQLSSYVYPRRVTSVEVLKPAYNRFDGADVVNCDDGSLCSGEEMDSVVFPGQDPSALGTRPLVDINGDGLINATDDVAGTRQAYGPGDGAVCWNTSVLAVTAGSMCGIPAAESRWFYRISGYDVTKSNEPSNNQYELRYARFWSNFSVGDNSIDPAYGIGSEFDDPRQLGYTNPPDDTVVTWNSYFREWEGAGQPKPIRRDIVLLLNGSARPWDSKALYDYSWRQASN